MNGTKNWYAVYTRPRWEKKVAERLSKSNYEVYCPLNKVSKQWADRKKIALEPLFTSYVFVHISDKELSYVKEVNGIVNFVYWLGKPAVIREDEIVAIKDFLEQCNDVRLEKGKVDISVNEKVKITNGALIYKEGNVIEVQRKSVKVYLPSLGYNLIAEIDKANIEVIEEFQIKHRLVS